MVLIFIRLWLSHYPPRHIAHGDEEEGEGYEEEEFHGLGSFLNDITHSHGLASHWYSGFLVLIP